MENEVAGGFIGGVLLLAFLYFIYTKIRNPGSRKGSGGSGRDKEGGDGTEPGFKK